MHCTQKKILSIGGIIVAFALVGAGAVLGYRYWLQRQGPSQALQLAPATATGAVWIPDLSAFARDTSGYLTKLTQHAGASMLQRFRQGLAEQYGADPFDPKAFDHWGLDASAGALLFMPAHDAQPILVVAVKDSKRLRAWLKERGAASGFAGTPQESKIGRHTVYTVGPTVDQKMTPAWHYVVIGRYIMLTNDAGRPGLDEAVQQWDAGRQATSSTEAAHDLAADATWQRLSKSVMQGTIVLFNRAPKPSMFSIALREQGVDIDAVIDDMGELMQATKSLPAAKDLAAHWDSDAVLAVLADIPTSLKVLQQAQEHPQSSQYVLVAQLVGLQRAIESLLEQNLGVSAERDILPHVAGPLTMSVRIAEPIRMLQSLQNRGPNVWLNVLGAFDFSYVLQVTSRANATQILHHIDRKLVAQKNQFVRRVATDKALTVTSYAPKGVHGTIPTVGWALWDDQLGVRVTTADVMPFLQQAKSNTGGLTQALKDSVASQCADKPGTQLLWLRAEPLARMIDVLAQDPSMGAGMGGLLISVRNMVRTVGDIVIGVRLEGNQLRWQLHEKLATDK